MQFKTLVIQLLRGRFPEIHRQLKESRTLLPVLDHYGKVLKTSLEASTDSMSESRPGSDPSQIKCEALEIALRNLEDRLQAELAPDGREPLTLDAAMAFLRVRAPSE